MKCLILSVVLLMIVSGLSDSTISVNAQSNQEYYTYISSNGSDYSIRMINPSDLSDTQLTELPINIDESIKVSLLSPDSEWVVLILSGTGISVQPEPVWLRFFNLRTSEIININSLFILPERFTSFTGSVQDYAWSPDSRYFAFSNLISTTSGQNIYIYDLDAHTLTNITPSSTNHYRIAWSQDSTRLATNSARIGTEGNVHYAIDIFNVATFSVTSSIEFEQLSQANIVIPTDTCDLFWSTNDSYLSFVNMCDSTFASATREVYVINVQSSTFTQATHITPTSIPQEDLLFSGGYEIGWVDSQRLLIGGHFGQNSFSGNLPRELILTTQVYDATTQTTQTISSDFRSEWTDATPTLLAYRVNIYDSSWQLSDGRVEIADFNGQTFSIIASGPLGCNLAWNHTNTILAYKGEDAVNIRACWTQATDLLHFLDASTGQHISYSPQGFIAPLGWIQIEDEPTTACDHDIPASDTATLIATITTANSSGNPTTICLAQDSTYTFTAINNNLNALPRITGDITIEGQNATITRSGATNFRFFEVEPGATFTLNDLTLSNGDVGDERGGALLNDGDLTLNAVTFNGNSATSGGAIDSESGSATITDSTFINNTGVYGGAIDNDDTAIMTISGSTFADNHALADAGAIHNDGATLTVSDTAFTTNTADDYAGAIDNDDGDLTVNASTFTSNSADGGGAIRNDGALTINAGSVFTTNVANNLGWGGAIYNKSDSTVVINASSFSGNTANLDGGAIRNSGTLTVYAGSTFNGNTAAQYGGAIYNTSATATLTGVEITDNTATTYDAGGVYGNSSTSITITDSTLSGNDSGRRGGGIWSSGTTALTNVYLTNNTAVVEGGGIYGSSSATISAGNSCISGNSSRAAYSASSTNQNFENNWWGATDGPSGSGSGSGDAVNSKIDFTPFINTNCPLP